MYYILRENIALRSWNLVPYAYYIYGRRNAIGLTRDEFDILLQCDGKTILEKSSLLDSLTARHLCRPCTNGEELSDWQKYIHCDNRYFPSLNWTITGKCNLNCRHCFMAADNAPLMSEFTFEQCLNLLDQMKLCGIQTVSLTGGEPLIHTNFLDIVKECCKRKIEINEVITNGCFVSEKLLDEFIALDCYPLFKVSFDGLGHHDWLRGQEGIEKSTIEVIKLLKTKGFSVKIQMNVHKGNLDTMLPTAIFFDKMGIGEIRIIRTTEAPRWEKNGKNLCLDIEEYYNASLEFIKQFISTKPKINVDIWQFLSFFPKSKCYHLRPVEGGYNNYKEKSPVCRGNRGMISIVANGDIVPCNQVSGKLALNNVCMGNVHKQTLQSLLQKSPYLDHVTSTVGELQNENLCCQTCEYWKLCLGGCRACAYALTDNLMGYDPIKCIYFKKGYMQKSMELLNNVGYHCIDDIVK